MSSPLLKSSQGFDRAQQNISIAQPSILFIIYNSMSLRAICIIIALLQAYSLDYQDRCLYYGEKDNVCYGFSQDKIILKYNLDFNQTLTHIVSGETACADEQIYYWKMVHPHKQFADSGEDYYIYFSQETRVISTFGRVQQIIQRTRVVNATFYKTPYQCEIIGDGTVQHFGITDLVYPPCTHYIKCEQMSATQ